MLREATERSHQSQAQMVTLFQDRDALREEVQRLRHAIEQYEQAK
jgi:hypothetical protein